MTIFSRIFAYLTRRNIGYHVGRHVWTGPKCEIFAAGNKDCAQHRAHKIPWETRFGQQTETMLGGDNVFKEAGKCQECGAIIIEITNGG